MQIQVSPVIRFYSLLSVLLCKIVLPILKYFHLSRNTRFILNTLLFEGHSSRISVSRIYKCLKIPV
jgi:hypothetical protein